MLGVKCAAVRGGSIGSLADLGEDLRGKILEIQSTKRERPNLIWKGLEVAQESSSKGVFNSNLLSKLV